MITVFYGNSNVSPYTGMYLPYDLCSHIPWDNWKKMLLCLALNYHCKYSGISSPKKWMISCKYECIGGGVGVIDPIFARMHWFWWLLSVSFGFQAFKLCIHGNYVAFLFICNLNPQRCSNWVCNQMSFVYNCVII